MRSPLQRDHAQPADRDGVALQISADGLDDSRSTVPVHIPRSRSANAGRFSASCASSHTYSIPGSLDGRRASTILGASSRFFKKNGRATRSNTSIGKIALREREIAPPMPGESSRQVLRQLNTIFHCGVSGPQSDEELLEQFVSGSEETAEAAFTALVHRHGAMVLGVCRRVLGNRHAAEDAFQATFLVLARKATAIGRREQLGSWLHGVARRASMDARLRAARQHAKEKRLSIMSPVERMDEIQKSELRSILDEELARLPERHRTAIVLCELEGLSRREAAGRLGVSEGTLSSRLARAKIRLRDRLTRRGLALSAAALAFALTEDAQAVAVPLSLVDKTIRVATLVGTGSSLAGVASTSVIILTEGVLKAMLLSKLKLVFLGLVTVALITTGAGVVAQDRPSDNDRLKNLERKVDRLLEALGAQNKRAPRTDRSSDSRPEPNPTPRALTQPTAAPTVNLPIAAPPQPSQPPAAPGGYAPTPFEPGSPTAVIAATPAPVPPLPPPAMVPPASHANSLALRLDRLEQRLASLERRFADFDRRLSGLNSRPSPTQPSRNIPDELPAPRAEAPPAAPASPGLSPDTAPAEGAGPVRSVSPALRAVPPPPTAPAAAAPPPPASEPAAAPELPASESSDGRAPAA
jgi:RNA polymerase sigma-70 factor (ECF subfamily)